MSGTYVSGSAMLVIVKGASFTGGDGNIAKAADAHKLSEKILNISTANVVIAHSLFGPDDLIVLVAGDTPDDAARTVHDIRGLLSDHHNFVTGTKSHIITSVYGRSLVRQAWAEPKKVGAWLLIQVGRPKPGEDIARAMLSLDDDLVKFVAPVFGDQDLFAYMEHDDLGAIQKVIDRGIRPMRFINSTDTRITSVN